MIENLQAVAKNIPDADNVAQTQPSNQNHITHQLLLEVQENLNTHGEVLRKIYELLKTPSAAHSQIERTDSIKELLHAILNTHRELLRKIYGLLEAASAEQAQVNRVQLELLQTVVQNHESENTQRQLVVRLLANINRAILRM